MDRWTHGQMDTWTDGHMDTWTDREHPKTGNRTYRAQAFIRVYMCINYYTDTPPLKTGNVTE